MKSTIRKSLATTAIVLAVGITPVFAKGNFNAKNNSNNRQQNHMNQNQLDQNLLKQKSTKSTGGRHGGKMLSNPDVMGTVTAISEKDSTVTIKDADGKETVIHVNPLTRITKILTVEEKEALKSDDTTNTTKTQKAVSLTIADIKKGDWIAVAKMETETKVLEAKQIAVQVK